MPGKITSGVVHFGGQGLIVASRRHRAVSYGVHLTVGYTRAACFGRYRGRNSQILTEKRHICGYFDQWNCNRRCMKVHVSSDKDHEMKRFGERGEVKAVLFDMDGVLCNSESVSRKAAAEVMKELYGLEVSPDEFIPFTGTGEANFLGGVARKFGAPFEVESCKEKFFEVYLNTYAVPGSGIGYDGARELVKACRDAGLKTAVASSADLIKVHANLKAAEIPLDLFDTIVSADAFENLKPSPDIFLAASEQLEVLPSECVVIEDAVAGVQAARAAKMRVVGVVTTLAEDKMVEASPDRMFPDISKISVDDLKQLEDTTLQKV